MYSILIVDDEEPARALMKTYAEKIEDLNIVAVLDNALDAKKIIQSQAIDIMITDIEMDDLTGIDLVKLLKQPPITIFSTAYPEYALEGYDLDIADYLVKPVSFQRFCKAIDKTKELIQFRQLKEQSSPANSPAPETSSYFFVKTNRKMVKVFYEDILFTESYGEYVKIYTKDDVILALQTTNFMETTLPKQDFYRIHRSNIININHIKEIDGNQVVIDKHRLVISKRSKEAFFTFITQKGLI